MCTVNDDDEDEEIMESKKTEQRAAWQEAANINLTKVEELELASERATLLLETAEIVETKLDDTANAFSIALRAFWEIPTKQQTIEEVERLADLTGWWPDVYNTATAALEKTPGRTAQILLLSKLGTWCASKLGQLDHAFDCYSQILQIDPTNIDAYRSIVDLYGTGEQWNELASALEVAASNCSDLNVTKQFLFVRGRVLEQHAEDILEASSSYERVLEIDSGHRNALDALDKIYAKGDQWWKLLAIINRKIAAAAEDTEKLELMIRKGELLATTAEDPEGAVDAYNDALRVDRRHLPALEALETTYRSLGQLTKVRDVLEQQIEAAPDDDSRRERLVRLATMCEETLWEPDRAVAAWQKVLEQVPKDRTALDSLIRIYRRRRQFNDLALALKQAIESREDDPSIEELYLELGQVLVSELNQAEEAEEPFRTVLLFEPDHIEALEGLAKAQEMAEKWSTAEATLNQLLVLRGDDKAKEEINFKLGSLMENQKDHSSEAINYYTRVRTNNPEHRETLRALHRVYLQIDSLSDAVEVIQAEYELEGAAKKKAALSAELGALHQRQGREETAREWFEGALDIDQFNATAAKEMATIHLAENDFENAASLLEMLVRTEAAADEEDHRSFLLDLSRAYKKLGKIGQAVETAQMAQKTAPADLDSLRTLGEALFDAEQWEEAQTAYQRLIVKVGVSGEDSALLLYRMAVIQSHLKKKRNAINSLKKALTIAPEHRPSLELLIRINREEKKYPDVISYLKQLAGLVEDEERFEIMTEIGDLATEKLDDHEVAIEAYDEAIRIKPEDRPTLHKLLPHCQAVGLWPKVVDIVWLIIETETDPSRRARLHNSMGVIYRDELHQPEESIACFQAALDENPEDRDVFATLVDLLTETGDWEKLEHAYRKTLQRVQGKNAPDRETELWHSLGQVLFHQNKDFSKAAEAFKMADSLDPHSQERRELLASCYINLPGRVDDAIDEYRKLVIVDPTNVIYYKHLGNLLAQQGRIDETWNVSAALVAQGQANPTEREFYQCRRPKTPDSATAPLTTEQWGGLIAHRDDDPVISGIFQAITPAIASPMEQPFKAYGLKKRNKVSPKDDSAVAEVYHRVVHLLGLSFAPELYIKPGDSTPFSFTLSDPPRSVVGDAYVEMRSPAELQFAMTKHLTDSRPGHRIRWVIPAVGELQVILLATMRLSVPDFNPPGFESGPPGLESGVGKRYVDTLGQLLSSEQIDEIRDSAVMLAGRAEIPSVKRWIAGVEHTACRAALLLCGDLCQTIQHVKTHHFGTNGPTVSEKVTDLLAYGMSKEYAALRVALKLCSEESNRNTAQR